MPADSGGDPAFTDYYDLLGVDADASREAIMAAYREQVTRHHPDVSDDEGDPAYRFKHLSEARAVLSNPARREEYDRLGHREYRHRYADGGTLTPGTGESDTPSTDRDRSTPSWYRADNRSAAEAVDPTDRGVDTGTVIEGDSETTIDDLVARDPVEQAWRGFKLGWTGRLLVGAGVAVLASVLGLDATASVGVVAASALAAVVLTGGYAMVRLPTATTPETPPESATVGLLRPARFARYRRWGGRLLALALGMTVLGARSPPHPWVSLAEGGVHPWVEAGTLGAPRLLGPVNVGLTVLVAVSLVGGALTTLLGVSGAAWYRRHAGHGGWPLCWDVALAVGVTALLGGLAAGADPISGVPAVRSVGTLGSEGGHATGVSLAIFGALALLVVGLAARVRR